MAWAGWVQVCFRKNTITQHPKYARYERHYSAIVHSAAAPAAATRRCWGDTSLHTANGGNVNANVLKWRHETAHLC